jgi:aspartate dehydrogenase
VDEIGYKAYKTLKEIIDDNPDYVIEAASPDIFKDIGAQTQNSRLGRTSLLDEENV